MARCWSRASCRIVRIGKRSRGDSRKAALEYAADLNAGHFEGVLRQVLTRDKKTPATQAETAPELSPEKKKIGAGSECFARRRSLPAGFQELKR